MSSRLHGPLSHITATILYIGTKCYRIIMTIVKKKKTTETRRRWRQYLGCRGVTVMGHILGTDLHIIIILHCVFIVLGVYICIEPSVIEIRARLLRYYSYPPLFFFFSMPSSKTLGRQTMNRATRNYCY